MWVLIEQIIYLWRNVNLSSFIVIFGLGLKIVRNKLVFNFLSVVFTYVFNFLVDVFNVYRYKD